MGLNQDKHSTTLASTSRSSRGAAVGIWLSVDRTRGRYTLQLWELIIEVIHSIYSMDG